ncbi:MAG: hypothetical protein QOK13_474 [Gaiellaceae bacterium]|nr:hypothetical protein [Gaiellaceae bacterium]
MIEGVPGPYFTVEEATAALEHVRPLAESMVAHRSALAAAGARWNDLAGKIAGNGGGLDRGELAGLQEKIEREQAEVARCVRAIQSHGAQVKDVDTGLLDFAAQRDGMEIELCWQVGEERIEFWHGVDEGFAGRKPL